VKTGKKKNEGDEDLKRKRGPWDFGEHNNRGKWGILVFMVSHDVGKKGRRSTSGRGLPCACSGTS